MLSLPPTVKIYVAAEPVDLRRGFDGLAAATRQVIGKDPLSGHLFCFINRRRNRLKILAWERSGYWLHYKRLEKGKFWMPRPEAAEARHVEMEFSELQLMLEGIDLQGARRRPRWEPLRAAGSDEVPALRRAK